MILEKLIEKKDIQIYIETRISHLETELNNTLKQTPEKKREFVKERFAGRIRELEKLRAVIAQGKIKDACKNYWEDMATTN